MAFAIYAIYSESLDIIYIGQTNDIEKRLKNHLNGYSNFTARASDWKLFYTEFKGSRAEALKREKQLKSSRGRAFLRDKLGLHS